MKRGRSGSKPLNLSGNYDANIRKLQRNSVKAPLVGPMDNLQAYDRRLPEAFWSKIEVCWATGCWVWEGTRGVGRDGRAAVVPRVHPGLFGWQGRIKRNRKMAVRRVLWELSRGVEPEGIVSVGCGTPCCVNPCHLVPFSPYGYARSSEAYDPEGISIVGSLDRWRNDTHGAKH